MKPWLSAFLICLILSCSDNSKPQNSVTPDKDSNPVHSPFITIIDKLADSLKPETILVADRPLPLHVEMPHSPGGTYQRPGNKGELITVNMFPPRSVLLPVLKNHSGDVVSDSSGLAYILGGGGKSTFTNFTAENGLPVETIPCSMLDKSGKLWFGTNGGGISCFDGQSFINLNSSQGLPNDIIRAIIEDRKGIIWIGTYGEGLGRYDGKLFSIFKKEDGLTNNNIHCLFEDKKGVLWVGTDDGISRFDGMKFENFGTRNGLPPNPVYCIEEDSKGRIWFGTIGGGAFYFNGITFNNLTTKEGLSNNIIRSIREDHSGNIWFGTAGNGLCKYNGNSFSNFTMRDGLASNDINCITKDYQDNLWIGTNGGGASRYDGKSFTSFTTSEGLSNDNVLSAIEDRAGNIWFGTDGGGVSRYGGAAVTNLSPSQGMGHHSVYSISEDSLGNIWLGTHRGGVYKFDGKAFTNYTTAQGLGQNSILAIARDNKGRFWFGSYGSGVSCFDGQSFTTYTKKQGLIDDNIMSAYCDSKGNLWLGTFAGISRFDGNSFTNFTAKQGIGNNSVFNILEDKKGNIWFATRGAGISRFDGKSFARYDTTQGLASENINCIFEDSRGNLWFGTNGSGLSRFDGKSFSTFAKHLGLANDVVSDIVQDRRGNIVIGTNEGFTVIPEKFTSEDFSKIQPVIEYYNNTAGYPIRNINGMNALFCDSKGIIWAGTGSEKTGLVKFDYSRLFKSQAKPLVEIKGITIKKEVVLWNDLLPRNHKNDSISNLYKKFEELIILGRELTEEHRNGIRKRFGRIRYDSISSFHPLPINMVLPYKFNELSFDFNCIETGAPQLVNYQYILEGNDKDWSPVSRKTTASYGNIWEGNYTFKVRAKGPNGIWSEPLLFHFKVLPPWYRTWWAYAIYGVAFVLLGWWFLRVQKARAIRIEKEKANQLELEHAREIEKAYTDLKNTQTQLIHSEKMASLGVLTAGIAHEIQNPLNFVNNFSEVNQELLSELKTEAGKNNLAEVKKIADDVLSNEEKIAHHGKQADAIVKNMLQHSRSGSNKKESTDLNALAEEYLRLAYHGLRARDNTFTTRLETSFDPAVGKIEVVPQEVGRVLLNLINNALFAVDQKRKLNRENYEPVVEIATMKMKDNVRITVKDNGNGIPENLRDKIFQPFFTTKPTGQGTGLGLSLSYDIIQAHGGEIKIESREGEYAAFIINLPAKPK